MGLHLGGRGLPPEGEGVLHWEEEICLGVGQIPHRYMGYYGYANDRAVLNRLECLLF